MILVVGLLVLRVSLFVDNSTAVGDRLALACFVETSALTFGRRTFMQSWNVVLNGLCSEYGLSTLHLGC